MHVNKGEVRGLFENRLNTENATVAKPSGDRWN